VTYTVILNEALTTDIHRIAIIYGVEVESSTKNDVLLNLSILTKQAYRILFNMC
jgi:hypothetical protein